MSGPPRDRLRPPQVKPMVEMVETFHCPYCRLTMLESRQRDREEHLEACKKGAENRAAMEYKLGSHSWRDATPVTHSHRCFKCGKPVDCYAPERCGCQTTEVGCFQCLGSS